MFVHPLRRWITVGRGEGDSVERGEFEKLRSDT